MMHILGTRITQIALIVVILASLVFVLATNAGGTIVLSSPRVETLEPHPHTESDSADDTGHGILFDSYVTVENDVWITAIDVELYNAPPHILHHLILSSSEGPDPECPDTAQIRDYIAVGQDTPRTFKFEAPYGIRILKGTELHLSTMLHNPERQGESGRTYKDVQATVRLTTASKADVRTKNIELLRIAVQDTPYCSKDPKGPGFSVPPHVERYIKIPNDGKDRGRFVASTPGTIIDGYAHIHGWDGGRSVSLYLNDKEIITWKTHAETSTDSPFESWRTPQLPLQFDVKQGDTLSVSSEYTNSSNEAVRNAMGAARVFFYPEVGG